MITQRKEGYQLLKEWQVLEVPPDPYKANLGAGGDAWKGLRGI
jgi:hypothetical protein